MAWLIVGVLVALAVITLLVVLARRRRGPRPAAALVTREEPGRRVAQAAAVDRAGRVTRLSAGARELGARVRAVLSREIEPGTWEELQEVLIAGDVGVQTSETLVDRLRERAEAEGAKTADQLMTLLRDEALHVLQDADRNLRLRDDGTTVVLVTGVNGVGKTTTIAKLARHLLDEGHSVLLGAADTFRAAATEQLGTWAGRLGIDCIRGQAGSDPAAVAHDAVGAAVARGVDVVIVDTAGRLHTKKNLMQELGKVWRVAAREGGAVHEALLVIDATTGQNGIAQAREFGGAVDLTGVVLTKLDGSAKGGVALAIEDQLGLPVKLVGTGEGLEDLEPFDPESYVDALLGTG